MRRPSGVWRSRTPAAAHEWLQPGGCITSLLRGRPQQPQRRHRLQLRCVFFNTHSARACLLANTPLKGSQMLAPAHCRAPNTLRPDGKEGPLCQCASGAQGPSRGFPRACLRVDGSADRDVTGLFGLPRLGARLRLRPVVKWLPRPGEDRRSYQVVRFDDGDEYSTGGRPHALQNDESRWTADDECCGRHMRWRRTSLVASAGSLGTTTTRGGTSFGGVVVSGQCQ